VVVGPVAHGRGILAQAHRTDGALRNTFVTGIPGGHWYDAGRPRLYSENLPGARQMFLSVGDYGREKHARAGVLAAAGFTPPVLGLAYGFILYQFVDGRPLEPADMSPTLLHRMAQYYAFVARLFRLPSAPRFEQLAELILYNVGRATDTDASSFIETWKSCADKVDRLQLARLDGRPFPHEWIETASTGEGRYLKADSADHCLDHSLVGEQSILWDLAGACEEWEMNSDQLRSFLDSWKRETGDASAEKLLEFYRAAYLAFRTGALHYAIHSTNEEDIRRALQHQQFKINSRLRAILDPLATDSASKTEPARRFI
jgi:hypothetical protein